MVRYQRFLHQAASLGQGQRRTVAKVEVYFEELFLHRGFIVTGFQTLSRAEVGFHNKRGVAEQQRIKEPVRVK